MGPDLIFEIATPLGFTVRCNGRVIGFELLHYRPAGTTTGLSVETVVRTES